MKRIKVLTIVGTRPELIKLSRVVAELRAQTEHVLVHTGQNYDYELNQLFFDELELPRPDHFLDAAGATPAETVGQVIARVDPVLAAERPDAVLLLGDTNSCLAGIAAKRRQIPLFHMEAGNRCFDERVPEEINRRIVDHISDVNLVYTEHARRHLLAEGLRHETVIKTGSPMREVLEHYRGGIEASDVLVRLGLAPRGYYLASAHREENVDAPERLERLVQSLESLAAAHDLPVIFSTHPRTRTRLEARAGPALDPRVRSIKPLGFFDWVQLQRQAACVLSDSGTLTEEAALLDFPAVTLRLAHERPEGMDEGTLVMCDLEPERVLQAVALVRSRFEPGRRRFRVPPDYEPDNVSLKVARILVSHVDWVNRRVWYRGV